MYHHAYAIARAARFNNCHIISVHRDYNATGQTQWEVYIGTDRWGGFKETVAATRKEAIERALDIAAASEGFIKEVWAQHGREFKLIH